MKDKQVMQRFNQYLNRAFFANQDPFIKQKHELYIIKKGESTKQEKFFSRMQVDKEIRERKDSIRKTFGRTEN